MAVLKHSELNDVSEQTRKPDTADVICKGRWRANLCLVLVLAAIATSLSFSPRVTMAGCGLETPRPSIQPSASRLDLRKTDLARSRTPTQQTLTQTGTTQSVGSVARLNRTRYVWDAEVAGVQRCALIDAPKGVRKPSAVLFFHGRGGSAPESADLLRLEARWPEAVIAYGEGTVFDSTNKRGWEIRFPHMLTHCHRGEKDLAYVNALLDQLAREHDIDKKNVFVAGHSNGGFFSLSLAELLADRLRGVVAIGAYTSYAPALNQVDCSTTYSDGISQLPLATRMATLDTLNKGIGRSAVDTLLIFGRWEKVIKPSLTWIPDCDKFSYLRNSIIQLTLKNGSGPPVCSATQNFMQPLTRQVFASIDSQGATTELQIYDGYHGLEPIAEEAADWLIGFFKARN